MNNHNTSPTESTSDLDHRILKCYPTCIRLQPRCQNLRTLFVVSTMKQSVRTHYKSKEIIYMYASSKHQFGIDIDIVYDQFHMEGSLCIDYHVFNISGIRG